MSLRKLIGKEIEITVKDHGAELVSLKERKTGCEYMWNADPAYWGKTSPILFPFVGGLKDNLYEFEGRKYQMRKHGFARDMEFQFISQDENSIWFELSANEETLKCYPFLFKLRQGYEIKDKTVIVHWKVWNEQNEVMHFSLGGHPAFFCPIGQEREGKKSNLKFDKNINELISTQITPEGLAGLKKTNYPLENGMLQISEHLFDEDALVIENHQVNYVELADAYGKAYLRVSFDAPLFGIWAPAGGKAPFVCIEPWYGRCDAKEFQGTLEERVWGNQLLPGEIFDAEYRITVL